MANSPALSPAGWRCCLPTPDATTISLSCPIAADSPWLAGRALDILRQEAGVRPDPNAERYALGTRRGAPLILGEPLLWNGVPVLAEAVELAGGAVGEFTLRLPPGAELAEAIDEARLWEVADRLAQEFSSPCGVISDGRTVGYPDLRRPAAACLRLQRLHLGVLLPPAWVPHLRSGSTPYWELPLSRLVVVLE